MTPMDDPITLTKAARALLSILFPAPGIRYARAGVVLTDLRAADGVRPLDLFRPKFEGRCVGQALDEINRKFATTAVGVDLGGIKAPPGREKKRELLSPRCLTDWEELLVAAACSTRSSACRAIQDEMSVVTHSLNRVGSIKGAVRVNRWLLISSRDIEARQR